MLGTLTSSQSQCNPLRNKTGEPNDSPVQLQSILPDTSNPLTIMVSIRLVGWYKFHSNNEPLMEKMTHESEALSEILKIHFTPALIIEIIVFNEI